MENINVTITSPKTNSIATALRAHLNSTLSYRKLGETELMEKEIESLKRDVQLFIEAVRSK